MVKKRSIGEKIKYFRMRSGLSQLDLELELGMGSGALSRIESGKTEPTKETLSKIVDRLGLTTWETIHLFDLKPSGFPELMRLTQKLYSETNLDNILQMTVNDICKELKLHGSTVCLREGDYVRLTDFTQAWYYKIALRIIGKRFSKLQIPMSAKSNLVVRAIEENKSFITLKCSDFVVPIFNAAKSDLLQKATRTISCIVMPLSSSGESPIGAVIFSKDYVDDFSKELPILESFTEVIAESILKH